MQYLKVFFEKVKKDMLSKVVVAALTVLLGVPTNHATKPIFGRVVGGENTTIEEYPYQASLEWYGNQICGASVISEKYLITGAYCTNDGNPSDLTVRTNSTFTGIGGECIRVKAFFRNSNFSLNVRMDWDISILELQRNLNFGVGVQPIALPIPGTQIEDGTEVAVTGWGIYDVHEEDYSDNLRVAFVNVLSNSQCQAIYVTEEITPRMICAGVPEGGKDFCNGDSGGPLVANGTLWGIVSWGYGCGLVGYPGVYSNVAALRDYITKVTGL